MKRLVSLGLLALAITACVDGDRPGPTEVRAAPQAVSRAELFRALLAGPLSVACQDGQLPSGSLFRVCVPTPWNGELIVYNHGYTNPLEPLHIPDDSLGGTPVADIVTQLGFAFIAGSFPKNGLAVQQGVDEAVQLAQLFAGTLAQPRHVYVTGASEGGLISALAVERHPEVFNAGIAACGPIGDFRAQLDYFGDFRVVFDYFFASRIPGWPKWRQSLPADPGFIPQAQIDQWESFQPLIAAAVAADPSRTGQLLNVTHAAVDPADPTSIANTVLRVLRYNVVGDNDAIATLGGQPFDNSRRIYLGSRNDLALNLGVKRFDDTGSALANIAAFYQTTGHLVRPLTTLHTTLDPEVPFWHEALYLIKALGGGSGLLLTEIPALRYGHCNFTQAEVLAARAVTVLKVTGQELLVSDRVLPSADLQRQLVKVAGERGAHPQILRR
jgi:pimeloyl-ACP methyl ester carboxylesterase